AIPSQGTVVLAVAGSGKLGTAAARLDKKTRGVLTRAMKDAAFKGKKEQTLSIHAPGGTRLDRVVLVGLGDVKSLDEVAAERIGAVIYKAVADSQSATVVLEGVDGAELAACVAGGALQRSYRFDKYRTKERKEEKPKLKTLTIQCGNPTEAKKAFSSVSAVVEGIFFTRDLVSEPANILYPVEFAARAKTLSKLGIKVEVLGEAAMKKLGMGALLGVGD
ncbi:MAG: M17 family peptidase N-terminal domain-containing protein, partial [Rhodospirillaceae bacterium]